MKSTFYTSIRKLLNSYNLFLGAGAIRNNGTSVEMKNLWNRDSKDSGSFMLSKEILKTKIKNLKININNRSTNIKLVTEIKNKISIYLLCAHKKNSMGHFIAITGKIKGRNHNNIKKPERVQTLVIFCFLFISTTLANAESLRENINKNQSTEFCNLKGILLKSRNESNNQELELNLCLKDLDNKSMIASKESNWNLIIELTKNIIEIKEYKLGISNNFTADSGIGVALKKSINQYPVIKIIIKDLGADKAGLRENDMLMQVGGIDTKHLDINTIVGMIRGKENSNIRIRYKRMRILKNVDILRRRIQKDSDINLSPFWQENMRILMAYSKLDQWQKSIELYPIAYKSYIDKHGDKDPFATNLIYVQALTLSLANQYTKSQLTIEEALKNIYKYGTADSIQKYQLYSLKFENAERLKNDKIAQEALEKAFLTYESLPAPISNAQNFSMSNNINLFLNSNVCNTFIAKKYSCLEYAEKSVEISLTSFGSSSKEYASALHAYGSQLLIAGEVKETLVIFKKLINILEQENLMVGKQRLGVLNLYASSYASELNFLEAEQIRRKALNYSIKFFGINSIESFEQRLELAEYLSSIFKTREAIEEAKTIIKESDILLSPAKIFTDKNIIKIEEIRLKAIGQLLNLLIAQRAEIKEINYVENILSKLNQKYINEKSVETATAPAFINIDIYKKNYSRALSRKNKYLAQIVAYSKNNELYKEFKESPIIHNGMKLREIAGIYEGKAAIQSLLNEYKGSLESIQASIKIRQALSKSNPSELAQMAYLYNNAAHIEVNLAHLDSAKLYAEKSIALSKQYKSGQSSLNETSSYKILGIIHILKNNLTSGVHNLSIFLENEYINTYNQLWLMPSYQKKHAVSASDSDHHVLFYDFGNKDQLNKIALEAKVNLYALAKEIELIQNLLLSSSNSEDYKRLIQLREKLNTLKIEQDKKEEIGISADELEAKIMHGLEIKRRKFLSVKQISESLPKNAYLIEFKKYYTYPSLTKTYASDKRIAKYVGYIVNFDGNVTRVDLGNADKIDSEISIALAATSQNQSDAGMRWHKVSKSVLKPFVNLIKPGAELFIAPDSELSNIPFAALEIPNKKNQYLADFARLRLINSGRDLVENKNDDDQQNPAIVIANPKFNTLDEVYDKNNNLDPVASSKRGGSNGRWAQLPSSEIEGQKVAEILEVKLISGVDASTSKIKMTNSPRILHIASHGSFGDLSSNSSVSDFKSNKLFEPPGEKITAGNLQDPYIVLAGANTPEDLADNDDGILSLAETAGLNLRGTQLVVLSACNTSSGKFNTGDGVFGLQRALSLAGARSSLLSLWKVDDEATASFMASYYKRLKAGEARSDALAAVQKEFRDGAIPAWKHPYYWAAWQLVGDWKPINGI